MKLLYENALKSSVIAIKHPRAPLTGFISCRYRFTYKQYTEEYKAKKEIIDVILLFLKNPRFKHYIIRPTAADPFHKRSWCR